MEPHTKIPSRTELCRRHLSTRTTIDRAIAELNKEGYLYAKRGSGTYVADLSGEMNVYEHVENWGVIVHNVMRDTYPGILRGIEDFAQRKNINVVYCNSDNDPEKQKKYIQRLIVTGVKGVIIVPVIRSKGELSAYKCLTEQGIPFVFCNRSVEGMNIPLITSNNFYGGYIATKYLIERGYRKIAYIAEDLYQTSIERYEGYVAAMHEAGLVVEDSRVIVQSQSDGQSIENNKEFQELMCHEEKPDAIFCFNDSVGSRVMKYLQERGYKIPEDIGVIAYDNTDICEVLTPKLTSVSYKTEEIGEKAAEVLYRVIHGEGIGKFNLFLFQPSIMERESC